ncbi:hypothetical protein FPRO06_09846 [Fusarium proliferatum]|nr:hypothetical protein FPRO06_09846 [Fusarium proliferatum]
MSPHHPPDPSRFSGDHWLERRRFISKYLEYLGGDSSVKWKEELRIAYEVAMEGLQKKGRIQVSNQWLVYQADRLAWEKFSSDQGAKVIDWPWNDDAIDPNDISYGVSPTYQEWRLERGLPICDTPKAVGSKRAMVLSLGQREVAWTSSRPFHVPITGPFQIAIPAWVDLDNLVFGNDHSLLDVINNDIIPPHLAVSWHNKDTSHITKVVGFNPTSCIDPENEEAQNSLNYLWEGIVIWTVGAYFGETMTLATFLRIRKAVPSASDNIFGICNLMSHAEESFNEVQEDILGSKEQARKKQEFVACCRPAVLDIIRKPFIEAKAELTKWILQDDTAFKERTEAAHEIWVSSTTNERTIQEVCTWAWGLHQKDV